MADFTASEKRTIDRGYYALARAVESNSVLDQSMTEAFKHERRGRSSAYFAKAILCYSALRGIMEPLNLADVALDSRGCQAMEIAGAWLDEHAKVTPALLEALREAVAAKDAAIERRLRALNPGVKFASDYAS